MTDVILRISGMDCGACAVRIVRALRGLPGLREVSVSDTAGCARLTYDETAVDLGEIARRVQRAGFDVPVGMAELRCPDADAGAEARLRAVFGVRSVARAGDTFTVTLWPVGTDAAALPAVLGPGTELTAQHGGEETLQGRARQRLARWLGLGVLLTALMLWRPPVFVQLVLAAAVLFGVGAALWRSTWRALRGGSLGPDAPGLLAALILFAYSTYAAFAGLQPCFPALCGIACAQLAGKCAAQLVRGTLAAPVQRLRHLRPRTATVVRDGVQAQTDAGTLTPQDVVHILPGERIPVDGIVRSGVCTVDESALTGASRPVEKTVGDAVLAGTLDRAGSASVTPTAVGDATVLQRTIAALQRAQTVRRNQLGMFVIRTLEFLRKGGRIGKVTGRAANMLGLKPMILFKDGEIFSGGVARGRQKSFEKALEQLMNYLDAHGGTPDDYRITVGYGYDADEGKRLWMQTRAALRAKYPGAQCEVGLLQIGCTIAVHTGPYALGMGVMRRWKKQG